MIQWDGSAELKAILDGVFKPPQREERRSRQRFAKTGAMRQPIMTASTPALDGGLPVSQDPLAPPVNQITHPTRLASTEDLVREGYAADRVINPPPPTPSAAEDATADLLGLGYVPPASRIWPGER